MASWFRVWAQGAQPATTGLETMQFTHLSTRVGLSNNDIWSMHQDREGFMWFGTANGLNRYDGYTFTIFKPDPTDPDNSLQHYIITDIHEDRSGKLWVTTFGGGLNQIDKQTGKVTGFGIPPIRLDLWNVFTSIFEDRKGIFWLASIKGVVRFDPKTKVHKTFAAPSTDWLSAIAGDSTGRIWVGSSSGVYQFEPQTGRYNPILLDATLPKQPMAGSMLLDKKGVLWVSTLKNGLYRLNTRKSATRFNPYNPGNLIFPAIRAYNQGLYEDLEGYLWVATSGGLQRIDTGTDQVVTLRSNISKHGSLNANNIQCLFQDRTGTFWVGTGVGVNKSLANAKTFVTHQILPVQSTSYLSQNNISTLLQDSRGIIWLGSAGEHSSGAYANGLYQYNPKNNVYTHIPAQANHPGSLPDNEVWALHEDQKGLLWVGTSKGLSQLDPATGKIKHYPFEQPVFAIDEDRQGNLWLVLRFPKSAIARFNPGTGKSVLYSPNRNSDDNPKAATALNDDNLYDIMVSSSGDIYVATGGGGINRLNPETNKFTYYLPKPHFSATHLTDKDVKTLYEDEQGSIWAGTGQGGLNSLDPKTGQCTFYSTHDGLPSNHVVSITGDEKGNLWLGTDQGLSCFNPKTKVFRNFYHNDGLPANDFRLGAVYRQNGKLLFGTVNGFVIFNPETIGNNTTVPPVYITGFKVLEKSRPVPAGKVELPYDQNFLSFDFVVLNYNSPEKNKYAYKLNGVDKNWVYTSQRRYASYTDLPPGTYIFQVKGSNNDGVWNQKGTSLHIIIHPPWWRTWWAYALYALAFIGLTVFFIRVRLQQERERQGLERERWEAEQLRNLDELKTRFFSNITHEFRTPLSLILPPTEQMLQEVKEPKHRQRLTMIKRNARQLLGLINQLLDISKLESGSLQPVDSQGDITEFIRNLLDAFRPAAEEKEIILSYKTPSATGEWFFDADKWSKIINNLLSNAIKFTPPGGSITVELNIITSPLSVALSGGSNNTAEITIQDSGIGIPAENISHIFNRFYQVDNSHTRAFDGTGIGLSLVKELVDLLQGQIEVNSTPEAGTVFTLELPIHKTENCSDVLAGQVATGVVDGINLEQHTNGLPKTDPKPLQAAEVPLLLVVDDNADFREFISGELARNYRLLTAANGEEGWKLVQQELPEVVISDVMMPVLDGYELTELIKNNPLTNHIAIILLTAKTAQESKVAGLAQGADDYLTKPFHLQELKLRLRNLLDHQEKLRQHYQQQSISPQPGPPAEKMENPFLRKLYQAIEEQLDNSKFDVDALAEAAAMGRRTLYRKLATITGLSPNDVIRNYRLLRATQLLQAGHSVSQVAYQVGFESPSYFGQCFKEKYKITPSEYHQQHLAQS